MSQKTGKKGEPQESDKVSRGHSQGKESIHDLTIRSSAVDESVTIAQIVKINDRGVIVVPKEILEKMDIGHGRDLLLLSLTQDGKVPMMVLFPSDQITEDIKDKLKDMKVD